MISNLWDIFKKRISKDELPAVKGKRGTDVVLVDILKKLGCAYEEEKDDEGEKLFDFKYQGGSFRVITTSGSPTVEIFFSNFFQTEIENLQAVRYLCNKMNHRLRISKCIYTMDEEDNRIRVHASCGSLLLDEIPNNKEIFSELLESNFTIRETFVRDFEDIKSEFKKTDFEKSVSERAREIFLLREQELNHQIEELRWHLHDTKRLSLHELLATFYKMDKIELHQAYLVTDSMRVLTSKEALELDLSSLLIGKSVEGEYQLSNRHATLILFYNETRVVTLDIRDEGESEFSFYFRITVCDPPLSIDRNVTLNSEMNEPSSFSFLVAFDKKSAEAKRTEFNYMWQDAKDKITDGKMSEMNEEQRLICHCTFTDSAYNIYWGKRLANDKRYYEALLHLENAYHTQKQLFRSFDDDERDDFYELCYCIGFCYMELKLFKHAYYYLDYLFSLNRIRYTQEYINCLVNAHDFRALIIIDNSLDNLELPDNPKDIELQLLDFIHFLRRRKGYALIDAGELDEAEKLFTSMLEDPKDKDYALEELAYIQSIRKSKLLLKGG